MTENENIKDKLQLENSGLVAEELPRMAQEGIHAGFPSPANDYMTQAIDLNRELVKHPAATFYGRVVGDSMIDAGGFVDGEFTLKHLRLHAGGISLVPANKKYPVIEVGEGTDFKMWGVVTYVIKKIR